MSWTCDIRVTIRPPAPDERLWHGTIEIKGNVLTVTAYSAAHLNEQISETIYEYLRSNAGKKS